MAVEAVVRVVVAIIDGGGLCINMKSFRPMFCFSTLIGELPMQSKGSQSELSVNDTSCHR